jgi:hypothetical protein
MPSNINPNNINGAYPVAGQDNDSQGFRDNFTNTKTNFAFASAEITDLQAKAVLKSALTGTVLDNNMNNSVLSNAQFINCSVPKRELGTVTAAELNFASSSYYTFTTGGSVTISLVNFPPSGQMGSLRFQANITNTNYTLILPSAVSIGVTNVQGYSNNVITFNKTGVYEFEILTSDAGGSFSLFDLNRNRDPLFLPSKENLTFSSNVGNPSLLVTATYFTTTGTCTGTLAVGSEGQLKTIMARDVTSGTYTLTVTDAGWRSSGNGTITFDAVGESVMLQYIGAKWYAVGVNGATLA